MRLSEFNTTSFSFNYASGIGGVAKKKIYDVYADPSAGKSTLGYDLIGNCQKKFGEWALLIDKEDSYSPTYGAAMGIDNEKLIVINNKYYFYLDGMVFAINFIASRNN